MKFRPCIDIHKGVVKQIIGSTLADNDLISPITNFASEHPASWFASLYRSDSLYGGHVIQLGKGNERQAEEALTAWPNALQIGGGITDRNAVSWLKKGACKVIVTSYVFQNGEIHYEGLKKLNHLAGKKQLVLDLSCRKRAGQYWIVTDRWQKFTNVTITTKTLDYFSQFCSEFLIHAVDAEGICKGIELEIVQLLGKWRKIPITYAGGICSWHDIELIGKFGAKQIDFTVGSALDIFGGTGLQYEELVRHNRDGFRNI